MKFASIILSFLSFTALTFAQSDNDNKTLSENTSMGKTPEWIKEFNALPKEQRMEYITKFREAQTKFTEKRPVEGLFILQEIEKIFSKSPSFYNLKGACYVEIRDIPKAIECFTKALSFDPNNISIQFNLAESHYVNHDYKIALEDFSRLLERITQANPKAAKEVSPLLNFKRLICAYKLGDQKMFDELKTLYGPMDDTPYYYCTESIVHFAKNDKTAAAQSLMSALRIFGGTNSLQAFTDAMSEAGIMPALSTQSVQEDKSKINPLKFN